MMTRLRLALARAASGIRLGTLATVLALGALGTVAAPRKADALIVAIIVATPTVWFVRTMLFSREAH